MLDKCLLYFKGTLWGRTQKWNKWLELLKKVEWWFFSFLIQSVKITSSRYSTCPRSGVQSSGEIDCAQIMEGKKEVQGGFCKVGCACMRACVWQGLPTAELCGISRDLSLSGFQIRTQVICGEGGRLLQCPKSLMRVRAAKGSGGG